MYRVLAAKGLVKIRHPTEEISKRVYETLGLRLEFPKDDVCLGIIDYRKRGYSTVLQRR